LEPEDIIESPIRVQPTGPNGTSLCKGVNINEGPKGPADLSCYRTIGNHLLATAQVSREPQNMRVMPECFRNDFFEVKKSTLAGFGAFAVKEIPWGQIILIEKTLFRANDDTLFDEIDKLTPWEKQAYDRMHAHSNHPSVLRDKAIFQTNRYVIHSILTRPRGCYQNLEPYNWPSSYSII
jgi:hypothetical protein